MASWSLWLTLIGRAADSLSLFLAKAKGKEDLWLIEDVGLFHFRVVNVETQVTVEADKDAVIVVLAPDTTEMAEIPSGAAPVAVG